MKNCWNRVLALFFAVTFCVGTLGYAAEATNTRVIAPEDSVSASLDTRIEDFVSAKISALQLDIRISNVRHVVDFAGNDYVVVECSPTGYFIIHPASGTITEYSTSAVSPFSAYPEGSVLVYGGPTYYYTYQNETYLHTVIDENLPRELVAQAMQVCSDANEEMLSRPVTAMVNYLSGNQTLEQTISPDSASTNNVRLSGADNLISGYSWFRNRSTNFGYIDGNCCGYVAANLVLKFHHDYRRTISLPNAYSSNTSTALTTKLREYGSSNTTTAMSITTVINEFAADHGIPQAASYALLGVGALQELDTYDRPCIMFGNIPNPNPNASSVGIAHAVVLYGYNYYENEGHTTYIVHFGWNGYSEVHVNGLDATWGSNAKYKV